NPKLDYLRRTLDALRVQTMPTSHWELLLIDNASEPPLDSNLLSWHPNARCIIESEPGLASARRRGIRESLGGLLIFVDDDNVLDPSYLSEALLIKQEWDHLGAFGSGAIIPEFEREPADHLRSFVRFLSLRKNDKDFWTNMIPNSEAT